MVYHVFGPSSAGFPGSLRGNLMRSRLGRTGSNILTRVASVLGAGLTCCIIVLTSGARNSMQVSQVGARGAPPLEPSWQPLSAHISRTLLNRQSCELSSDTLIRLSLSEVQYLPLCICSYSFKREKERSISHLLAHSPDLYNARARN